MRFKRLALLVFAFVVVAGAAGAADWTTEISGAGKSCTKIGRGDTCWVATAGAATSYMYVGGCKKWKIIVWGTGVSVTPQACTDDTCGTVENLTATALTGDQPNTCAATIFPFDFIRLNTTDSVDVSIACGI